MKEKTVVMVGCGSVGSMVALEMARSGVGNIVLVDSDILQYHNICRHQCGIRDIGRYKVDAVSDAIHNINPECNTLTYNIPLEEIAEKDVDAFCTKGTVIVGCADERSSDVYANHIAASYHIPFLSIGFWERATVGELFYWLPDRNMPCYECALSQDTTISKRVESRNHHIYSNEASLESIRFEPGISVDISIVVSVGNKILLDLLNRNDNSYRPRLINNLTQFTLICNTNDPEIGGPMVEIFSYPLQVTTSLTVDFKTKCKGKCRWE